MALKKKPKAPEKENGERWMVSYADFITLLLALFIILYAMATTDAKEAGSDGSGQAAALAAIASAFGNNSLLEYSGDSVVDMYSGSELTVEAIEERTMQQIKQEIDTFSEGLGGLNSDSIEVSVDGAGVHIRIKDTILFNSGSYVINPNAVHIVAKIGDALKHLPNNYIQIEGHTDNVPMSGTNTYIPTNWELGSLRAVNVLKMLVEKAGLNPTFLSATSYGEYKPVDTNATTEGKARNRRVEITILRNYEMPE